MSSIAALQDRARAAPVSTAGFVIAAASAATLAGAWFFEFVLGLEPCPLCLDQRVPYYIAVPLGLGVAWLASNPRALPVARAGLAVLALVLLVGAGYGIYHAGIEWDFWSGPAACAAAGLAPDNADILSALRQAQQVVPCNEAAWRFLGISLAGYNVLIAAGLAAIAFWASFANAARRSA